MRTVGAGRVQAVVSQECQRVDAVRIKNHRQVQLNQQDLDDIGDLRAQADARPNRGNTRGFGKFQDGRHGVFRKAVRFHFDRQASGHVTRIASGDTRLHIAWRGDLYESRTAAQGGTAAEHGRADMPRLPATTNTLPNVPLWESAAQGANTGSVEMVFIRITDLNRCTGDKPFAADAERSPADCRRIELERATAVKQIAQRGRPRCTRACPIGRARADRPIPAALSPLSLRGEWLPGRAPAIARSVHSTTCTHTFRESFSDARTSIGSSLSGAATRSWRRR